MASRSCLVTSCYSASWPSANATAIATATPTATSNACDSRPIIFPCATITESRRLCHLPLVGNLQRVLRCATVNLPEPGRCLVLRLRLVFSRTPGAAINKGKDIYLSILGLQSPVSQFFLLWPSGLFLLFTGCERQQSKTFSFDFLRLVLCAHKYCGAAKLIDARKTNNAPTTCCCFVISSTTFYSHARSLAFYSHQAPAVCIPKAG